MVIKALYYIYSVEGDSQQTLHFEGYEYVRLNVFQCGLCLGLRPRHMRRTILTWVQRRGHIHTYAFMDDQNWDASQEWFI